MFTDQLQNSSQEQRPSEPQREKLTSFEGVDLSAFQCCQLKPDPIFATYENSDVHYAIGAVQKGLKPPTKVGLKRMKNKNFQKRNALKLKVQADPNYIQSLNPQSPEAICMKALRRQFKEQIAPTVAEDQKKSESVDSSSAMRNRFAPKPKLTQEQKNAKRRPKFIRKKENQLKRRIELITLVNEHREALTKIFSYEKLKGFNRKTKCPMISRQEVKAALSKYHEQKAKECLEKVRVLNDPDELKKFVEDKQKEREIKREKIKKEREERRVILENSLRKREKSREKRARRQRGEVVSSDDSDVNEIQSSSDSESSWSSESEQNSAYPATP